MMKIEPITPAQATRLTDLICELRPEWDRAGVWAKVVEAKDRGTPWDLAHAALYAAENPAVRSPGVIPKAGEHWTRGKGLGQTTSSVTGRYARCELEGHEHEAAHACRMCRSEALEAAVQGAHQVERVPVVPAVRVAEILAGAGVGGVGRDD